MRNHLGRHVYLTFVALDERGQPTPVPPVEPRDEEERRLHEQGRKLYEQRKSTRTRIFLG